MRSLVVHAHCYQPPREDPWLELVPREPSAAPDHDWNERITRECYRPLSRVRLLDASGRITAVHNAWSWLSFDVGPTLVNWLAEHAPDVIAAMVAGDRQAIERTGHGTAVAHPYHHIILPLASRADKRTEVRWGIREFTRTFGREPLGMWLPETAVDGETLEVLAEEGIRYTIVAPHQVSDAGSSGSPLRWTRDDHELLLLPYDGTLAHQVAFGDLLDDSSRLAARLENADHEAVTTIATDGETYGHHHRFGDLAIGGLIARMSEHPTIRMVGADAVVTGIPAGDEVDLVEPTSWSCIHGVERWRSNCGCRDDPETQQEWRTPLRVGLGLLAAGLDEVVEREWPRDAGNRHEVRDIAGPMLDGAGPLPMSARRLLEAERHRLAMFTSCAWFFDDIARIEPRVVLRHAARALEFLPDDDGEALEEALLTALAEAESNDPTAGTGADIWKRDILPGRALPSRLAAGLAALVEASRGSPPEVAIPSFDWQVKPELVKLTHRSTGSVLSWHAQPITLGAVATRVHLRKAGGDATGTMVLTREFPAPVRRALLQLVLPMIAGRLLGDKSNWETTDPAVLRRVAMAAAWQQASTTDLARAEPLLHAALDLWALANRDVEDDVRATAWTRLDHCERSPARQRLADRFGVVLGTAR